MFSMSLRKSFESERLLLFLLGDVLKSDFLAKKPIRLLLNSVVIFYLHKNSKLILLNKKLIVNIL